MRVDELARDVGISKRTLYEQFRTKEEMAQEALTRLTHRLHDGVDEILTEGISEADKLRAIVLRICRTYAKARPPFFRDLETTPVLHDQVELCQDRCFGAIEELVRTGVGNGSFRPDLDARLVRRTLMAAIRASVRTEVLDQEQTTIEQALDGVVDLVLHGMYPRPAG